MEKTLVLKTEIREHTGSKDAVRVRQLGKVPAIVYGHKQEPIAISLDAHDFIEEIHHGHRLMEIQLGRKKQNVIVKDLQYDYLGKDIIHADLMRVDESETVKVTVPIELKGTAKGTHEGGIIEEHLDRLEIECKVSDIPETITVWVKDIGIGDSLHASDVELPQDMKLETDTSALVVTCHLVAAAKSTEEIEEEIPSAPEVIGETEEEQESEQDKNQ